MLLLVFALVLAVRVLDLHETRYALVLVKLTLEHLPPLHYFANAIAHVLELEVRSRFRASVFVVLVVVEVDAFVVHQAGVFVFCRVIMLCTYPSCLASFSTFQI